MNEFIKWKETYWSNGLTVSLGKTELMVSSGITMSGLFKSEVEMKMCEF